MGHGRSKIEKITNRSDNTREAAFLKILLFNKTYQNCFKCLYKKQGGSVARSAF